MPLPPLVFAPRYEEKIWGGSALKSRLDKDIPENSAVGESWEISGLPGSASMPAAAGPDMRSLADLVRAYPAEILGACCAHDSFPLLYKFIDAADRLSVQVHPDDSYARSTDPRSSGKTEAWYIVDAPPGAQIIAGFARTVTVDEIAGAIQSNSLDSLLNYIDIRSGDMLFIPAGTVHAILARTLLYEIQQASDTTFRLYDWGRTNSRGKARELHISAALDTIDTACHRQHKIKPVVCADIDQVHHAYRAACRYFAVEEFRMSAAARFPLAKRKSFRVLSVLDSCAELVYAGGVLRLARGRTVLLPASLENVSVNGEPGMHFLMSWVPDIGEDIITPLRAQGFSDECICALGGYAATNDIMPLL